MDDESIKLHVFRLLPGQDLREEIEKFVKLNEIVAGCIFTCVGSLTQYNLRFANQAMGSSGTGHFEIIHLSGTVSKHGCHLHIGISDNGGGMIGGHLLENNVIYTTAEIVIAEFRYFSFGRQHDSETGFKELHIHQTTG
jgi:uncharacterized protein